MYTNRELVTLFLKVINFVNFKQLKIVKFRKNCPDISNLDDRIWTDREICLNNGDNVAFTFSFH